METNGSRSHTQENNIALNMKGGQGGAGGVKKNWCTMGCGAEVFLVVVRHTCFNTWAQLLKLLWTSHFAPQVFTGTVWHV